MAMVVVGKDVIDDFIRKNPKSKSAMTRWITITEGETWKSLVDLKKTFNATDYVPPEHTVFDIGGNKYRVITTIDYRLSLVAVTHALTHTEYDKDKWK